MGEWNRTPRTWAAGEVVTASMMNDELRDFARAFSDAGSTFTGPLTQNVTVTGTAKSGYLRVGRWVFGWFNLAVTGTGTASNVIELTLPVAAKESGSGGGSWWHLDSGVTNRTGFVAIHSTTRARFYLTGDGNPYGQTTGQLTSGDSFSVLFVYEAGA